MFWVSISDAMWANVLVPSSSAETGAGCGAGVSCFVEVLAIADKLDFEISTVGCSDEWKFRENLAGY